MSIFTDRGCAGCLALKLVVLFFIFTYPPFISLFFKVKSIHPNWELGLIILGLILWVFIFKLFDYFYKRFPIFVKLLLYGPLLLVIYVLVFGLSPDYASINPLHNTYVSSLVLIFASLVVIIWIYCQIFNGKYCTAGSNEDSDTEDGS